MEPFLGEIVMFAGNFAPRGWAFCQGQLLAISSYSALFSILGTTYGGDGRTTFGLPDLRGRIATQEGTGPGLSPVQLGQRGGREYVTLTINELPSHNHSGIGLTGTSTMTCSSDDGDSNEAAGRVLANAASGTPYVSGTPDENLGSTGAVTIGGHTANNGGQRSFSVQNPYLGLNFIISLQGTFPSRN